MTNNHCNYTDEKEDKFEKRANGRIEYISNGKDELILLSPERCHQYWWNENGGKETPDKPPKDSFEKCPKIPAKIIIREENVID